MCLSSAAATIYHAEGVWCGQSWGGPTRRDIERIIDMSAWPVFPNIKFGTYGEFFKLTEAIEDQLRRYRRAELCLYRLLYQPVPDQGQQRITKPPA